MNPLFCPLLDLALGCPSISLAHHCDDRHTSMYCESATHSSVRSTMVDGSASPSLSSPVHPTQSCHKVGPEKLCEMMMNEEDKVGPEIAFQVVDKVNRALLRVLSVKRV